MKDDALLATPYFEDPPDPPRIDRLRIVLEKVAAEPGRWARIAEFKSRKTALETASRVRRGKRGAIEGHSWEAVVRELDGGEHGLWVRLIDEAHDGH